MWGFRCTEWLEYTKFSRCEALSRVVPPEQAEKSVKCSVSACSHGDLGCFTPSCYPHPKCLRECNSWNIMKTLWPGFCISWGWVYILERRRSLLEVMLEEPSIPGKMWPELSPVDLLLFSAGGGQENVTRACRKPCLTFPLHSGKSLLHSPPGCVTMFSVKWTRLGHIVGGKKEMNHFPFKKNCF